MEGACGTYGGEERCVQGFWKVRPEGKGPTGRPRPRWKDNISMSLQHVEWGGMAWVALIQGRDRSGSV